jgi:anthranilate phosphoribosyltransferase
MDFFKYIKAVGTGPKGNRNLSYDEMIDCMSQILDQKIYSEQICAFLLGWRLQEETSEELKGALKAFDKYIKRTTIKNSIELGHAFDGKQKQPYLFTKIAPYLKKFDINLVISYDYTQPAKDGITTKKVYEYYKNSNQNSNLYYFNREDYCKNLSTLTQTRQKLGLRTGLNTIEKLLNPASSSYAITGAFHKPYVKKYLDLFNEYYKNFVVVKGAEGSCEFFKNSKYWIKNGDEIEEYDINLDYFGIKYDKKYDNISLDQMNEALLNPTKDLEKLIKLNAALLLIVAKKTSNIKDAYELIV